MGVLGRRRATVREVWYRVRVAAICFGPVMVLLGLLLAVVGLWIGAAYQR